MTAPPDPAVAAVAIVMEALADVYDPASTFPPEYGTRTVRFFAGNRPPTAAFNAHTSEAGCDEPFLWVRAVRRYRTKVLPNSEATSNACELPRALDLEIGVARCAVIARESITWADYDAEAATSLDDSWRIEKTLCIATTRLRADDYIAAGAALDPVGPEGAIIGWRTTIYIQFD